MAISQGITATQLNHEVILRVPRPISSGISDEVGLLDVAGRQIYLALVPPNQAYEVRSGTGIKVIAGSVAWTDPQGSSHERSRAIDPYTVASTIVESRDHTVNTANEGAVFILMKESTSSASAPYSDMSQLPARTIFPDRFPADVRQMSLPWVRVQDRPWANGKWKGVEFYNLAGFHFRYADSDEHLCHFQLWTAGVNVNAGFRNHIEQTFCEIHVCIANGTGKGGMSWATVSDMSKTESQVIPPMYEQGPMWRTGADGLPKLRINGTVDFGWHAWISGQGDPQKQSYDVWLVFEFPPLIARVVSAAATTLKVGRYRVRNQASLFGLAIADGNSADNTPVILRSPDEVATDQQWDIAQIPGTNLCTLKNVASSSFATASWPLVDGQKLVGSRSLAAMDITSSWSIESVTGVSAAFKIRLIGTDLYCAFSDNNDELTLRGAKDSDAAALWTFHEIGP